MDIRIKFQKLWIYSFSALFTVVVLQTLGSLALATDGEASGPSQLASLGIFNLFVYGSMVGLTISTLAIIGIWVKEMKDKTVW